MSQQSSLAFTAAAVMLVLPKACSRLVLCHLWSTLTTDDERPSIPEAESVDSHHDELHAAKLLSRRQEKRERFHNTDMFAWRFCVWKNAEEAIELVPNAMPTSLHTKWAMCDRTHLREGIAQS